MCGIAGILHFDGARPVDPALLDRATDVLAHRGPDGRGTWLGPGIGLGHRRLAVIDTSDAATQPLANEDGTVWIVFNGEIYNFGELRTELAERGHRFRSRSDTEVIVHLYEELGPAVVDRLRGMFAFAIWDARRETLLLARDRIGKKPLYWQSDERTLRFGSEIKAIVEDPAVPRRASLQALDLYLTYGYVPAPLTAFAGIHKLPPGHTLVVSRRGARELTRYWELRYGPKERVGGAKDRARVDGEVLALLDEATRLRLIADVPLGAFLSGGVDSSSVVAAMKLARSGPVRTFSIGFAEKAWDESRWARLVARHIGTEHTELRLDDGALERIERLAWHAGEPFADSSLIPTTGVAKLARAHVTVALTGDGGDEVFLGYGRYAGMALEAMLERIPVPVRRLAYVRGWGRTLNALGIGRGIALGDQIAHARGNRGAVLADRYFGRIECLSPELKRRVLTGDALRELAGHDARDLVRDLVRRSDGENLVERCAHADFTTYLPDDICAKVDVASMAHGLETRSPLLDHRLVERVARLPYRLKMRGLLGKTLLRRTQRARLPAPVLERRKMGFGIPLAHWFRGEFAAVLEDTLLGPRARERGLLDPRGVRALIDEHRATEGLATPLYTLLMLELWHRVYLDEAR